MHFVRGRYNAKDSSLDALHHVANGRIETLQFQIKENNKIAGKKLSELELANGVLIAAIIRNGKSIFPTGEDRLAIGDKIVVVYTLTKCNSYLRLVEEVSCHESIYCPFSYCQAPTY